MCYKQERELKDSLRIEEKIKDYPEFLQKYFERLPANSTKITNFSIINNMFEWFINNNIINKHSIDKIEPDDMKPINDLHITNYLDSLKNENSMSTIITKKKVISSLWDYFKIYKIADDNIAKTIARQKYKDEGVEDGEFDSVEIPTATQINTFMSNLYNILDNFKQVRNVAMITLLAATGMRSEELIGIDIDGIYLDEESPYVLTMRKGYTEVRKRIKIRTEAIKYIRPYVEMRKKIKVNDNALFLSVRMNRLSYRSLKNEFDRYGDGVYPHMMRHMFASDMYAKGTDLVTIQKMLNHKSYETTVKMYISVEHEEDFFEVLKRVDKEFGKTFDELVTA